MTGQDGDEHAAWKAAFLTMFFFSVLALVLRFLINRAFFTPEFEVSLVYLPTVLLLAVLLSESLKATRLEA